MTSNATIAKEFGKHAILYKKLRRRHKANPLFLQRSLLGQERRKENAPAFLQLSFRYNIPAESPYSAGHVSMFVLGRPCGAQQYCMLGARFFALASSPCAPCRLQVNLRDKSETPLLDDLFLLVLCSGIDSSRSQHEEWMGGVLR
ncbi:hypothetical protein EON65_53620, partial [archaeon]